MQETFKELLTFFVTFAPVEHLASARDLGYERDATGLDAQAVPRHSRA